VNLWGAGHVVIGTDYPYDMGWYKPVDFVNGARLTREQKEAIIGGNAAKLLGLRPRKK
jgi:aminocarboxymuconate-semialdehyde decarboxylase